MAEIDFDCVDAHFHIWDLQKFSYQWPTPDVPALFRNFTPEDLKEAAKDIPIKHAVFVQVLNNSPEEAIWVSQLAEQHDVIKGVVAGIDVTDPNVKSTLEKVMNGKNKVVGIRHILDNLEDEDTKWLSSDDVISGLRVLENLGIPFDLLLRPHLTKCVLRLSKELPRLKMVVDHLAKPYIKAGLIDEWKKDMTVIAENPNIYCKLTFWIVSDPADVCLALIGQFAPWQMHHTKTSSTSCSDWSESCRLATNVLFLEKTL
ncbi:L-fucono-1,5-lactonase-like isoform X2 [Littorina saxatilis]|uniref:L-fucono-1,5-lactonase-like isoform X2 n=1 Tax=Littorina saxatilis TaxID=31220 RepID=UPI0038B65047